MKLGDIANEAFAGGPRPLEGVRVLAAEQMAALPFATQLMARLGAEVVKLERPGSGETGRQSQPAITDPDGRTVGATFLRNNLNKRSVTLNLKDPRGVEIFLRLAPHFDVVGENFKAGGADALGIGYKAVRAVHPGAVYLSVSGFGAGPESPYRDRAAYASIVEAMSGILEYKRRPDHPPTANPVGALGDISAALFGVIGVLAALRQRDQPGPAFGLGQHIDVAMLDSTIAMTDIVTNFFSMGIADEAAANVGIVETFAAGQGHFVLQVVREHHFERLAEVTGNSQWLRDSRLASRRGWVTHLDDVLRPGVEGWAAGKTSTEAVAALTARGLAAGPSMTSAEVCADPHVAGRNMIVEMPRPDGGDPVFIPGNPIKMSRTAEGPETRVPWLGEHTDAVLAAELGLGPAELDGLRDAGVI